MNIINVNSKDTMPELAVKMCYSRDDFTHIIINRCPVFLVNKKTMDLLAPPYSYQTYDANCISLKTEEVLKRLEICVNENENVENPNYENISKIVNSFWDDVGSCSMQDMKKMPVCGLYINKITTNHLDIIKEDKISEYLGSEAIFLCIARIIEWESKSSFTSMNSEIDISVLISSVWFHEATHAWMKTSKKIYTQHWGYIIEESLANAYCSRVTKYMLKHNVFNIESELFLHTKLDQQPFPYSSWAFWEEDMNGMVQLWRDKDQYRVKLPKRARRIPLHYVRGRNTDSVVDQISDLLDYTDKIKNINNTELMWKLLAIKIVNWCY